MKCFFFAQSDSSDKLCKHYPKDLNTDGFVEEIQHLCNMGHSVFGEITSIQLLNIYSKDIENIFLQIYALL